MNENEYQSELAQELRNAEFADWLAYIEELMSDDDVSLNM